MKIIWFDVCALCIVLEVLYTCIIRRSLRVRQNFIFLAQLVVLMLTTIGSLIASIAQNAVYIGNVSSFFYDQGIMNAAVYLYMTMHILTPMFFVIYIYSLMGMEYSKMGEFLGLFLPVVVALLVLAATPATGAIFYFDEYNIYRRGSLMWVFYLVAAYYILYSVYLVILCWKSSRKDIVLSLSSFIIFSVAGVVIQYLDANCKVEDFCNSLVIIILYITVERPADYIDSQTDLQNQAAFYMNSETRFKRGSGMDIILLTIDNLTFLDKQIGTAKSDVLLVEAAKYLQSFSKSAVIYRLRRDAFALIMKNKAVTTVDNIQYEIRERFKEAFNTDNYNIILYDCSCYIKCPKDARTNTELKHLISLASLPESHKSRHRYDVNEVNLQADNRKRTIDRLLREAITDMQGFIIKYQPVYDVATGRFDGVQLKSLFKTKELGVIPRKEYLAVAVTNGTASVIETYIYTRLCSFIESSGISHYGIRDFAIELPIGALMMKGGADNIIMIADKHGVPHHLITFELSEDALMNYQGVVRYNIEKLRERGFMFSLINYGKGYTDAGTLLKMPLSSVTFDRMLTGRGMDNDMADTLLKCSISMLRRFNIRIKAESIENEDQLEYVRNLGCDMLQGYHLSTVFSEEDLAGFVKEKQNAL